MPSSFLTRGMRGYRWLKCVRMVRYALIFLPACSHMSGRPEIVSRGAAWWGRAGADLYGLLGGAVPLCNSLMLKVWLECGLNQMDAFQSWVDSIGWRGVGRSLQQPCSKGAGKAWKFPTPLHDAYGAA